jgi:uncharacterized protein
MKTYNIKVKLLILFLPCLLFFFSVPAFAERVVDNAGILSAAEKESLRTRADAIASTYNFDLVIVTERSINVLPRAYAEDFYDNNGYGLGSDRDGSIFLRVTGTRDYYISASGRGIRVLTDTAFDKLEADVGRHLARNQHYQAFHAYLQAWETFLELAAKGRSYNFFYQWNLFLVIGFWLLAFAIGFAVVHFWKKEMNTAIAKTHACNYIVPNSTNYNVKTDRFLYSTVTKTRRQSQNSGSSGGIGTSSSGRMHSGRGGRR